MSSAGVIPAFVAHPILDDVVAFDDGLHLQEGLLKSVPDQLLLQLTVLLQL